MVFSLAWFLEERKKVDIEPMEVAEGKACGQWDGDVAQVGHRVLDID